MSASLGKKIILLLLSTRYIYIARKELWLFLITATRKQAISPSPPFVLEPAAFNRNLRYSNGVIYIYKNGYAISTKQSSIRNSPKEKKNQ